MDNFDADFIIETNNLEAEYSVNPSEGFACSFELFASGTTWGNIDGELSNQTDLWEVLQSKADTLTVETLSETVTNNYNELDGRISSDHSEITDIALTIQSYGDIVTYDASDFATSVQGGLADSAIQPNDNISKLNNDAGYITSSSLPTVNNGTLTIQVNGTDLATFKANQSTDVTADITIPNSAVWGNITGTLADQTDLQTELNKKPTNNATGSQSIALGSSSTATATGSIAYGYEADATATYSMAIGWNASASNTNTIAIGKDAKATASGAIVIGTSSTNSTADTFQVKSYELLDLSNGLIPDARISNNIARTTDIPSLTNYVTTNTAQTISSSKAFSQPLVVADNNGLASGTILSNKKILQRSSGDNTLTLNNKDNKLRLVGSETRPKYSADGSTFGDLALYSDVTAIDDLIPAQATISNQLADKAYVNSSIQTASANFRGNWNDWADVPTVATDYPADYAGSKMPTVNDYLVVQDASDYTLDTLEGTWRFKYSGDWDNDGKSGWLPEYQVNETPLTQAQLDALNSGITAADVTLISTAVQPGDLATVATSGDYSDLINTPTIPTALSDLTVSAGSNITISGDTISATDTTYSDFTGCDSITAGAAGLVPAPSAGDEDKFLKANGTWDTVSGGVTVDQTYDGTSANAQSGVAISGALAGYVDLTSAQNITGTKTFVGQKKIAFKQSGSSDKLGFTLYNNSGTEKGYLEYNPSNTVDSVPLMTLGNYATASSGLTHVGFRKYDGVSSSAYNLLAPLASDAKSPFNLTTTYTHFYLPLGFTDGNTTVTTAKTGLVNISSLLPAVPTNISAFTNDSGYITSSALATKQDILTADNAGNNLVITPASTSWAAATQNANLGNNTWADIVHDGTKFVAISETGCISTSTDGTTWTHSVYVPNLGNNSWWRLVYNGAQFVAISDTGYVSTSTNGTTWAPAAQNAYLGNNSWRLLATNGSIFVAIGRAGKISTSSNGTSWSTATQNTNLGNQNWIDLTYDGTKFVALGISGHISTSTDGTTWTPAVKVTNLGDNKGWRSLSYNGAKFIALSYIGYTSTSIDGINWTTAVQSANLGSYSWRSIDFSSNKFVSIGETGYISSLDGFKISFVNNSGYITGINSSDVTTALGYTPYNATNPDGYITSSALSGYATETWVGNQGYITGINSSDVTTALGYTPVNKAGDTMTGGLDLSFSQLDLSTTISADTYKGVELQDDNHSRIGKFEAYQKTDGSYGIMLSAKQNGASTYNYIDMGFDSSNNAYCTIPNTECVDGQWVGSYQQVISSSTSLKASTNLSKRIELPNDGYTYEVMLRGQIVTGSASGNDVVLAVSGNKLNTTSYMGRAITRTSNTVVSAGSCIILASYVASDSTNINIARNNSWNGNCTELSVIAYRRIGTNT